MNFAEVNGTALRYDLLGSGAATLVLIHEMGGTIESWDLVAPMLSTKRRVLRYDTRAAEKRDELAPPQVEHAIYLPVADNGLRALVCGILSLR